MTGPGNRIQPTELAADDEHLDHDVATAYAVARRLEAELLATGSTIPSAGFGDRVMAAVAREPLPRAGAFLAPLRERRSFAGLRQSIGLAWRAALGSTLPARTRASAVAYVLAVLLVAGSMTTVVAYGAAGALGWLPTAPTRSEPPTSPESTVAPSNPLVEPGESVEPDESGQPEQSQEPEASGSAAPDDSAGAGSDGTSSSGDGGASPTSGEDHGSATPTPSASADATQTPRPSGTPKASQTPEPSTTPSPTSSSHG